MFIKLDAAGLWWPATDTASLHVKVVESSFDQAEATHRVFHERRLEVLPKGGDPETMLWTMTGFAIRQWGRLINMRSPIE